MSFVLYKKTSGFKVLDSHRGLGAKYYHFRHAGTPPPSCQEGYIVLQTTINRLCAIVGFALTSQDLRSLEYGVSSVANRKDVR
jgi:hypothetical protein